MSLHIVMTGSDRTAFVEGSETLKRFKLFAEKLQEISPNSMLSYIGPSECKIAKKQVEDGLTLIPANSALQYLLSLWKLNKERKISVLTTQTMFSDAWLSYVVGTLCHYPVVIQEHDDPFAALTLEKSHIKMLAKKIRLRLSLKLARFAAGVRAVNPNTVNEIKKHIGDRNIPVEVIPVPITLELSPRLKAPSRPNLIFVGRLDPQKNVDGFLTAARIVRQTIPELEITVVGDGSLRKDLEKIAPAGTVFRGWLEAKDIKSVYENASVLLAPSWYEGFGRILLEAMAAGVPVVTSTASGPSYIISLDGAGLISSPENTIELADHVRSILQSQQLYASLQKKGYDTAQRFTRENLAYQWMSFLYKVVIERCRIIS